MTTESPIQVPKVDLDEPVAVVPAASVAPLDGEPDGERINTFALLPQDNRVLSGSGADLVHALRDRVLTDPLKSIAAAFSIGFVLCRLLR